MELKYENDLCGYLQKILLIVLNGIEMCDAHRLVHALVSLLIVLNGIEMCDGRVERSALLAFNRTKWN